MNATADKLRMELATLSDAERAELARFLIQSLDEGADAGAESAWDAELERRAKEIRSGRATGEPADKVFSELRAKYS
ncbi:MAG: addiction module protein [Chloroflexi bacterium]|nr:addiction module protein [Chloroflexota bacterium]